MFKNGNWYNFFLRSYTISHNYLSLEYAQAGSYPFTYQKNDKTIALRYCYVHAEIIEASDLLKNWFNKSLKVATIHKPLLKKTD